MAEYVKVNFRAEVMISPELIDRKLLTMTNNMTRAMRGASAISVSSDLPIDLIV